MSALRPIDKFTTEAQFNEVRRIIDDLISAGKLEADGLVPSERSFFVERFISDTGETWLLAMPDQAFRGYLRKSCVE